MHELSSHKTHEAPTSHVRLATVYMLILMALIILVAAPYLKKLVTHQALESEWLILVPLSFLFLFFINFIFEIKSRHEFYLLPSDGIRMLFAVCITMSIWEALIQKGLLDKSALIGQAQMVIKNNFVIDLAIKTEGVHQTQSFLPDSLTNLHFGKGLP